MSALHEHVASLTDEQRQALRDALANAGPAARCVYSTRTADERALAAITTPPKTAFGKVDTSSDVAARLTEDERAALAAALESVR